MQFNLEPSQLDAVMMGLQLHKAISESTLQSLTLQANAQIQAQQPPPPPEPTDAPPAVA